jgi:hypothetical protein
MLMGMSFRAFFTRYLGIACWYESDTILVLSPRTKSDRGSLYGDRERGRCLLLGKNGCLLPFSHRPEECRTTYGCEPRSEDGLPDLIEVGDSPALALRKRIKTTWQKLSRKGQWAEEINTAWEIYMDSLPEV